MNYKRNMLFLLAVLAGLVLVACGSPAEPPDEAILTELLNQRDGVEGEYTFQSMTECEVEADQVGIEENWSVLYTRVDVDGAESAPVLVVKDTAGAWHLTDRDHCQLKF